MNISRIIRKAVKLAVVSSVGLGIGAGVAALVSGKKFTEVVAEGIVYTEQTMKKMQKCAHKEYVTVQTESTEPSESDFAE